MLIMKKDLSGIDLVHLGKMKCTNYVVTHKPFFQALPENYKTIVVGNHNLVLPNSIHDNTGDNISKKNKNYCELTALYWIWKNDTTSDIVSLNHYRRLFLNNSLFLDRKSLLDSKKEIRLLKNHDILLPFPMILMHLTVKDLLLRSRVRQKDLTELRLVILEKWPDYLAAYDEVMNGYEASYCNLFSMKKDLLNSYCEWLFDILFELEMRIDLSDYSEYESRIFGFLSERLINVWVRKNQLKVKYLDVLETENEVRLDYEMKMRIKHCLLKINSRQRK